MADFQNCHIWAWNLHAWPLAKIPEVAYSLSHRGSKLSSFSLYGQRILRYWPNFKTVIFRHEFQTCTLFLPQGVEIKVIFALRGQQFSRYGPIFKIAIFGHETWQLAKVPEVAHMLSFYPRRVKLSLFLLYGQRFPRYGPFFKIAIFGHETWQVAKVPKVAHISSFYPKGWKLSSFLLYAQRFPRYGPIFKIAIFGYETWQVTKVPEVAHIPSFYPRGVCVGVCAWGGWWVWGWGGGCGWGCVRGGARVCTFQWKSSLLYRMSIFFWIKIFMYICLQLCFAHFIMQMIVCRRT